MGPQAVVLTGRPMHHSCLPVLVTSLVTVTQCLTELTEGRKAHSLRVPSSVEGRVGQQEHGVAGHVVPQPHTPSQEAERDRCWGSVQFLFVKQSGKPVGR